MASLKAIHLSPVKQRLAVVGVLMVWCVVLLCYRLYLGDDVLAVGLLWNLFLAAVPLCWSAAFQLASKRNRPVWAGIFFFLWLLFFPNAHYILTDLIHLKPSRDAPEWYLLAMLLSCAGAGALLGYLSLINIQNAIDQNFGSLAGWIVASGSLMLCGFGIYVGRFLRWNSWDAFTRPMHLLKDVAGRFIDSGGHPHPLAVTLVFGVGLIIGYIALRVVATSTMAE